MYVIQRQDCIAVTADIDCQELRLLRAAGAEEFEPVLCDRYWNQDTWEVLQEMWRLW
jgi:hypothetical protein